MDHIVHGMLTREHEENGLRGSAWHCIVNLGVRDALRATPLPGFNPNPGLSVEVETAHVWLRSYRNGKRTHYHANLPAALRRVVAAYDTNQPLDLPITFTLIFTQED